VIPKLRKYQPVSLQDVVEIAGRPTSVSVAEAEGECGKANSTAGVMQQVERERQRISTTRDGQRRTLLTGGVPIRPRTLIRSVWNGHGEY